MTYGLVTADGWRARLALTGEALRVLVDGIDVTSRCMQADDRTGYALLLCKDRRDHDWRTTGSPTHVSPFGPFACVHEVHGRVAFLPDTPDGGRSR